MMMFFLLLMFFLTLLLTKGLRRFALQQNIMDVPNHRSSHSVPTPRGGGMAFVIGFTIALPFLFGAQLISASVFYALITAGPFIALLGVMDDRSSIPAKWRLLGHLAASICVLYCMRGMPSIIFFSWTFPSFFASISGVVFLIWLINLYNFMDGIDGLASVEAVTVCLSGSLLYWLTGHHAFMILPLILSASVAGFLYWNFPPARIFMGDAGSGFLGVILGVLTLQAGHIESQLFWSWGILLGVFIVDATITLLRRAISGQKVYEAHRSHAYQYASRRLGSHLHVTLAILMINVLWLLPVAALVGLGYIGGIQGLVIAYIPLIILAIQFNAGKPG